MLECTLIDLTNKKIYFGGTLTLTTMFILFYTAASPNMTTSNLPFISLKKYQVNITIRLELLSRRYALHKSKKPRLKNDFNVYVRLSSFGIYDWK